MLIPWAYDSWKPLDDKLAHLALAAWLAHLAGPFWAVGASIAVEVVEWWRWQRWVTTGAIGRWPFLADRPSYRDLVYDGLGIVFGMLVR